MADLKPPRVGPRDLYSLPIVGWCALHEQSGRIAYAVTRLDEEKNAYRGAIKVFDRARGDAPAITDGNARDQMPQWSPKGDKLFFLSDRTGSTQLWQVDAAGGDATALPTLPGNVSEFAVSPDGRRLAAVTTPVQEREAIERRGWRRVTRLRYRADGPGYLDDRPLIFVIDVAGATARQLTDGSGFVGAPAWSPDGARLAFCGDHEADFDSLWRRELWTAAATGDDKPRKVLTFGTSIEGPAWSPDGKRIAFCGVAEKRGAGGRNLRLFVADASGSNVACWMPDEEWTCGNFVLTDVGVAGNLLPPVWQGPEALAVLGSYRGAARVFAVRRGAKAEALTPADVSVSQFAIHSSRCEIVYCASDQLTPPEIYERSSQEKPRRLSHETKAWSERLPSIHVGYDSVRSGGWSIDAWHMTGTSATPRPCILAIHGGPHFAYGYAFVFHFIALAAAGFDVVFSNPRGSQSYGEAFTRAIEKDWARPAFDDCMAALDAAIAHGGIDTAKLGVTGGSYGGYLTLWAISHTDRFAAAVALRPASNLVSLWGTSEVGRMLADDFGGGPDVAPEVYAHDSPLTHAAAVRTPVLLVYGGQDYRTPAEQAEQFLTALLARGAIAEGLYFPNSDHNLSRLGPPRQRIAHEEAILEWFERFLRPRA